MNQKIDKITIDGVSFYEISEDIKKMLLNINVERKLRKNKKITLKRFTPFNNEKTFELSQTEVPLTEENRKESINNMLRMIPNFNVPYYDVNDHSSDYKIL